MNTTTDEAAKDTRVDISVVIPSYNHARYIVNAIESVISQSCSNWEIILIDDGSTDSTREILDQRYRDNPKIHLFYQSNHGAHQAINRGIALANGRYISILNSDDLYHPDRLQTLLDHSNADAPSLLFTPVTPINAEGADILDSDHPWCQLYARLFNLYQQRGAREALITGNFAVTSSNFFISAELLKQSGGFRKKKFNHDWDFMFRILRQGITIQCVGQFSLLSYRIHDRNTISQNTLLARIELKQILNNSVPKDDLLIRKLFLQMQINMRSIRLEHQAQVVNRTREEVTEKMKQPKNELVAEIEKMKQSQNELVARINSQELYLTKILNSRSYKFARQFSRCFNWLKKIPYYFK